MSFWSDLFHGGKESESVVLIDIGTGSVAGAYAHYAKGELPAIVYTRRMPIETREGEPHERAMLRALSLLAEALVREGGPALHRYTGSGAASAVFVSVDAPWQRADVRTEYLEQKTPFTFTRRLVESALEKTRADLPGEMLADESIIGTILNGYETHGPFGKTARRASIVILTSRINEQVARSISAILRSVFHTNRVLSIAGSSLRYQAMRIAFPHERDALILDATGPLTSIALVRRDLLVDVAEIEKGVTDAATWLAGVSRALADIAERFPLPRTIFVLAREPDVASLGKTLDEVDFRTLWLSDNPPKVVSVLASYLAGSVRQVATTPPDLVLVFMTLFYPYRSADES